MNTEYLPINNLHKKLHSLSWYWMFYPDKDDTDRLLRSDQLDIPRIQRDK